MQLLLTVLLIALIPNVVGNPISSFLGFIGSKLFNRNNEKDEKLTRDIIAMAKIEDDLRDLSLSYDVLRDQMASYKAANLIQKSEIRKMKGENARLKEEYKLSIEEIKAVFHAEKEKAQESLTESLAKEFEKEKISLERINEENLRKLEEMKVKFKEERESSKAKDEVILTLKDKQLIASKEIQDLKQQLRAALSKESELRNLSGGVQRQDMNTVTASTPSKRSSSSSSSSASRQSSPAPTNKSTGPRRK